jgi:uncharacterized protein (DUF433 family)
MKISVLIATATTAAVLGTAGISIAGATSDDGTSTKPADAAATATRPGAGANREARRAHRRHRVGQALEVAAATIGIERADLVKALREGKTIAKVATAHNVDPQAVVDALVHSAEEKLDAAVTAGKLSSERATEIESHLEDRVTRLVNSKHPRKDRKALRAAIRRHRRDAVKLAAEKIGITPADLVKELRDGKTIAEVATAHNVDPRTIIDALVAAANSRIDAAKNEGKITDEHAAKLTDRLPDRIAHLVNDKRHRERAGTNG